MSGLQVLLRRGLQRHASGARYFASSNDFFAEYQKHIDARAAMGIVPEPLNAAQCASVVELLKAPPAGKEKELVDLISNRVPPGVDEAAYVKAAFLSAIVKGEATSPVVSKEEALHLLGTMQGGYNLTTMIDALDTDLAPIAAEGLKHTLLMFDAFYDVEEKAKAGNKYAQETIKSWAEAEWFTSKDPLKEKFTLTVFKVTGETNTDDLSPAPDAFTRPDIPLHALAMLKIQREGIVPDADGTVGPMKQIEELKKKGNPLVYVGDVVGTGSSRKSATNSVLWLMGDDAPYIPNKRFGGVCLGSAIAPIFYNTMEDSGALPIELDVTDLNMGDVIELYPFKGECHVGDKVINFKLKTDVLIDEVRAGGRIPLIVGRNLTARARESLGLAPSDKFRLPKMPTTKLAGFTLAQKMVGKACGVDGVVPHQYCEPKMTTVGSQDTTGPMTRDELKDLACLGFSADLVMQSFCHTAAYPKPSDVITHHTLPDFIRTRGGVSLKPGDGIIHSWLNRMLLPDTVGTGGDSHTRFPVGISFPAGSGLVAFAAALGVMPLDMPESVRVRFVGEQQPGITLRDLVHAIPLEAIKRGLLTVEKKGKKNVFSGRILEIEGVEHLTAEQGFELSDASAERSAAGCTVQLSQESVAEYLRSNIVMLKWMISQGYGDVRTIERRVANMENWLQNPSLMRADETAEYYESIDINMSELKEPVVCCPNDPDDAKVLSDVAGTKIDEVFVGSCMTNIGPFRAAGTLLATYKDGQLPTKLWVVPPTRMDEAQLTAEGYYAIYGAVGARTEMPGCSLCMGNQARVANNSTVVSTSTRNFPNRLGNGANVYLASAELAAVAAITGKLPTPAEYQEQMATINPTAADTYRYLEFDKLESYAKTASEVEMGEGYWPTLKKLQAQMK
jgi:aconitate hydratase 2/2-methylisocitrate dehydratase